MGEATAQFVLIAAAVIVLVIALLVLVVQGVQALARAQPLFASLESAFVSLFDVLATTSAGLANTLGGFAVSVGTHFEQVLTLVEDDLGALARTFQDNGLAYAALASTLLVVSAGTVANAFFNGASTLPGALQTVASVTSQLGQLGIDMILQIDVLGQLALIAVLADLGGFFLGLINWVVSFFKVVLEPVLVALILPVTLTVAVVSQVLYPLASQVLALLNKLCALLPNGC